MTRRVVIVLAAAGALLAVALGATALTITWWEAPSPFTSVVLQGDAVVATLRPGGPFILFRSGSHQAQFISGAESFQLQDASSVLLNSAHESYQIACHTHRPPAGLQIQSRFFFHDIKGLGKKSFVTAQ